MAIYHSCVFLPQNWPKMGWKLSFSLQIPNIAGSRKNMCKRLFKRWHRSKRFNECPSLFNQNRLQRKFCWKNLKNWYCSAFTDPMLHYSGCTAGKRIGNTEYDQSRIGWACQIDVSYSGWCAQPVVDLGQSIVQIVFLRSLWAKIVSIEGWIL